MKTRLISLRACAMLAKHSGDAEEYSFDRFQRAGARCEPGGETTENGAAELIATEWRVYAMSVCAQLGWNRG
jgi:hypothetical protein